MYHEHQHTMRRIAMFWDEIDQSVWAEMSIPEVTVGGPYDPLSIMHYPMSQTTARTRLYKRIALARPQGFCNLNDEDDNCIDITSSMCNDTATKAMGQRKYLSPGDIAALNQFYSNAASNPSFASKTPMGLPDLLFSVHRICVRVFPHHLRRS
ncbi:hypothetical protein PsorP6_003377 [Peronosclerospora sorghi]|uniref:Uncharacterized protein n=1 Tax=Peronosclerospora sorghi TaxID=230839 RepID=A0ACC0VIW8_9STRA|nr:hypothetical protein PsorP6_003377 [Peronosclerospora sorghi]